MAKYDLKKLAARVAGRPAELMFTVVAGAAADTDIAISGITLRDGLVAVLEFQPPTAASGDGLVADRVGEAAITSDGNIQLDTTATTGNQLLVVWYKL